MPSPTELANQLRTIHVTSAVEIRKTVQAVLGQCLASDGVVFDRRVVSGGQMWMRDMLHHQAADSLLRMHARLVQHPNPVSGPRGMRGMPIKTREGKMFLETASLARRDELERSPLFVDYFRPFSILDQLRLFVIHGGVLVGWIGYFRTAGSPLFKSADRRLLQPLVKPITDALVAADRMQASASAPADLIVHPDGRIAHASESAQQWLGNESFRRGLTERVRAMDAGVVTHDSNGPLTSAEARFVRLDGVDGVRYLVNVLPAPAVSLAPDTSLTAREREVAEAAAVGASAPEIARALGSRPDTVRSQLKSIYRKLDVASRVELVRALRK